MPKPKSYPRKLLGHTNFNPPIIYTTETEIEHKWFYRVYISCKCTFSALPGHQYIPSYSLLETRFQKVQKFWLMGRAFGDLSLYSEDPSFQTTAFSELLADQSLISWPAAFMCGCLPLLFWQGEEKIFGLWELDNSMPCIANKSA